MYAMIDFSVSIDAEFNTNLVKELVKVKGYLRNGKYVNPFKRNQLVNNQAVQKLLTETVQNKEIPSRKRILSSIPKFLSDLNSNPVREIKEGLKRERAVLDLFADKFNVKPTKYSVGKAGLKNLIKKYPDQIENLAVNTVGTIASKVGGGVAGLPGQLAGDLGGALATRKAITDVKATRRALQTLRNDPTYQAADKLTKLKRIRSQSLFELKTELAETVKDNKVDDVSGWVIGNAVAEGTSAIPVLGSIPLRGASVAMPTTNKFVKAAKRIRQGEDRNVVLDDLQKDLRKTPMEIRRGLRNKVRKGNVREAKVRRELNKQLKRFLDDYEAR